MKNRNPTLLSFKPIDPGELRRLLEIARQDMDSFFREYPCWARLYAERILGVALCQGAAVHYIDPTAGINDFDVYTFFAAHPKRRWYAKRIKTIDFGSPKFGQSETRPGFRGRRVDLMGRALKVAPGADLISALRLWLTAGTTKTACELRKKPVILLEPEDQLGTVVWPQRPNQHLQATPR